MSVVYVLIHKVHKCKMLKAVRQSTAAVWSCCVLQFSSHLKQKMVKIVHLQHLYSLSLLSQRSDPSKLLRLFTRLFLTTKTFFAEY